LGGDKEAKGCGTEGEGGIEDRKYTLVDEVKKKISEVWKKKYDMGEMKKIEYSGSFWKELRKTRRLR